ncbi:MAG: hypothetical protein HZC41_08065 [Chloroflexi bacterium]|nr:hypothetical protein [Chloroflexota bacterium]
MKRTDIERLLPAIFQRTIRPGGLLAALLDSMETLHAPSEAVLANLAAYFDPYHTPDVFVPYLAGWVDLESLLIGVSDEAEAVSFPTGMGQLRELVAAAAFLSKWRGTHKGLLRFLETATGEKGFEINEQVPGPDGQPKPYHLHIRAPQATEAHRGLIESVIELEKPAYVTYELEFYSE